MNITEFTKTSDSLPNEGELILAMLPLLESPETKQVIGMTAVAVYYKSGSKFNVNGDELEINEGWYYADALPYRGEDGLVRLSNTLMPLRFEPTIWKQLNIYKEYNQKPTPSAIQLQ